MVRVIQGTAFTPVVNVEVADMLLYPRTVIGILDDVRVVTEVSSISAQVATVRLVPLSLTRLSQIDLSHLSPYESSTACSLLRKNVSGLSANEQDLGVRTSSHMTSMHFASRYFYILTTLLSFFRPQPTPGKGLERCGTEQVSCRRS